MYTTQPKKMMIINILEILRNYTDINHRLSQKQIVDILEKDYNMKVDRKAVKRNLENLIDSGHYVYNEETIRTSKNGEEETMYSDWYIEREFDDSELRLLIDSLLFSKHIPYNQCKKLIRKLEGLSNMYFKSKVAYIRSMPENLPENQELFLTIEVLDEAISENRQVSFKYNEYDIDKKMHPRKNSEGEDRVYIVNPYQMAATNGRYYLICNLDGKEGVGNYRMDRITDINKLESKIKHKTQNKGAMNKLDLPRHMAENIYMFGGESVRASFRAKRYIINDILDWFGRDIIFSDADESEVTASVRVSEQAMFYWAMQYGEHIEIIEPEGLRERVYEAAKAISKKYK